MTLVEYKEIMEHVSVTPEMKARVISNIRSAVLAAPKVVRFPHLKQIGTLAACFVLLLVGVFVMLRAGDRPGFHGVETAWGTVEYQSAAALSKASGIKIKDLEHLPFVPTQTTYLDYKNNLAEILYGTDKESLAYRVSKGSGDNSGDYYEYAEVRTVTLKGMEVTLKGDGKRIYCVLYEKGGYSYSLTSKSGLTEAQIKVILN